MTGATAAEFDALRDKISDAVLKAVESVCMEAGVYHGDAVAVGMAMAISSFLVGMGREFEEGVEQLSAKIGPLILSDFRKFAVYNVEQRGQA